MNLKDKFLYLNKRQQILFIVTLVLVIVFIVLLIIVAFKQKEKPVEVIEEPIEVVEIEEPEPVETEEPIVVEQSQMINRIVGTVKEVVDLGSKAQLTVVLPKGSTKEEINVTVNLNTESFDLETNQKFNPMELTQGDKVVIYAPGDYTKITVNVTVLLKGDDNGYSFGKLKGIQQDNEGAQLWTFYDTNDKLYVLPKSIRMIDAYTGLTNDMTSVLIDGSYILYKYNPDFEITSMGNIYTATDLILLTY